MNRTHSSANAPPALPAMHTSFVGRQREIAEISQLLESSAVVSLVGTGGCGKTRVALRVAADVGHRYPDGVYWIELARVTDPALIPQAVSKSLNIVETPGTSVLDAILNALRDKRLLLVLDNCEHLVETCAQLVDSLVSVPRLRILATSREALGISSEALYPLPPLPFPTRQQPFSEIGQFDAVQLFVERTRRILPSFALTPENAEVVGAICRDLDGVPLAIELASNRVNVLTVRQIQMRLHDRFELLVSTSREEGRHKTLRATIDWSYALLSPNEQLLLRRLAVFAPGFTLSMVEAVCAWGEIPPDQLLELLVSLVSKSLVVAETLQGSDARYHLLETIRQYAEEKLSDSGEGSSLRDRCLACFVQRTEDVAPKLQGANQELWLNWLESDNANIRAALAWANEHHPIESGLRIASAVGVFWHIRGYVREGVMWYRRLLSQVDEQIPLPVHVNALTNAAFLALLLRDVPAAREWGEKAVSLCEAAGDGGQTWLGYAFRGLASAAMAAGDVPTVFAMTERILLEFERSGGDTSTIGDTHFIRGITAITLGKYEVAHAHLEKALHFARERGDLFRMAGSLNAMGDLARCEEQFDQAGSLYEDSLSMSHGLSDAHGTAIKLRNLAVACIRQGDIERAHALLRQSVEASQALDDREAMGHSLQGFATLAAVIGFAEESAQLLAWAVTAIGVALQGADKLEFEYCQAFIRQKMSEAAFEAERAKGQALSLERAVALALSISPELDSTVSEAHDALGRLTAREREVAGLIARGLSNGKIAQELVLSKRTVEKHIANVLAKLDFTNRVQIVRWAIETGLTDAAP